MNKIKHDKHDKLNAKKTKTCSTDKRNVNISKFKQRIKFKTDNKNSALSI